MRMYQLNSKQNINKLELMDLNEQHFKALREELNMSLSTIKLEIDHLLELKKQTDHSESTVSSLFSETACKHMSFPPFQRQS